MRGWIREGRGEDGRMDKGGERGGWEGREGRMEQGEGKWEEVPISSLAFSHSKILQYYNTLM